MTNGIKKQASRIEGFKDNRANNLGRLRKKPKSLEDRVSAQDLEIRKLYQKVEFLKKHLFRGTIIAITAEPQKRRKIYIQEELVDNDNLISVKELCEIADIS